MICMTEFQSQKNRDARWYSNKPFRFLCSKQPGALDLKVCKIRSGKHIPEIVSKNDVFWIKASETLWLNFKKTPGLKPTTHSLKLRFEGWISWILKLFSIFLTTGAPSRNPRTGNHASPWGPRRGLCSPQVPVAGAVHNPGSRFSRNATQNHWDGFKPSKRQGGFIGLTVQMSSRLSAILWYFFPSP